MEEDHIFSNALQRVIKGLGPSLNQKITAHIEQKNVSKNIFFNDISQTKNTFEKLFSTEITNLIFSEIIKEIETFENTPERNLILEKIYELNFRK